MGDWAGFMDKIHEVVPTDQQPELLQKLSEGSFTLRLMYEQFQNILKMGPIGQVNYFSPWNFFEHLVKTNMNHPLTSRVRILVLEIKNDFGLFAGLLYVAWV
jgi:signal recognition particle GTPase